MWVEYGIIGAVVAICLFWLALRAFRFFAGGVRCSCASGGKECPVERVRAAIAGEHIPGQRTPGPDSPA